jgi:hypothetical protein
MAARPNRTLLLAEGLALLLAGAFLAGFSLSGDYWRLLHPKFQPLTLATGLGLLLLGALHPFSLRLAGRGRLSSLLAMLVFLALAGFAVGPHVLNGDRNQNQASPGAALGGFDPGPAPGSGSLFSPDAYGDVDDGPRLTHEGNEYVKLNVVELWMIADGDGDSDVEGGATPGSDAQDLGTGGRVALRGQVRLLPAAEGAPPRFAIVRVAVVCCLADAVASGFVVQGPMPEGVKEGDWVRVLGTTEPLEGAAPRLGDVYTPGVTLTVLHETLAIGPDAVEPAPMPDPPFLFEFRMDEPFAW